MTNLELRILSGLHRGAALPLDIATLELGAGEECDVVLADRGLAGRHARLAPSIAPGPTLWRLEALDGEVYDAFAATAQAAVDCSPGAFGRLGQVWICVSPVDAAWQAAPEPAPLPAELPAPDTACAPAAAASRPPAARTARAPKRRKRLVLLPFGIVIVLCAATAYAFTARPASPAAAAPEPGAALDAPAPAPGHGSPAAPVAARALTPPELRAAFERELSGAQVLERFELQLEDDRWRMRADLGEEERERFERMLSRFVAAHRIDFPVDARIVPSAALLPFRIEQVLTGAQAGIVTDGGQRLFVGDEYRGTRLVSMKDGRLVFAGKRKIEVQW